MHAHMQKSAFNPGNKYVPTAEFGNVNLLPNLHLYR